MPLYFVLSETKEIKVELLVRQAKKYRWCYTKNGLQSRSSENGKTAVWHYELKLQCY